MMHLFAFAHRHAAEVKTWAATVTAAVGVFVAQLELPDVVALPTTIFLLITLATVIVRYSFSQLESYRSNVEELNEQIAEMRKRMLVLEMRIAQLMSYATLLRVKLIEMGVDPPKLPTWEQLDDP